MSDQLNLNVERAAIARALNAVVAAIYFDDSSDYKTALYEVVRNLAPSLVEMTENDPRSAWEITDAATRTAPSAPMEEELPAPDEIVTALYRRFKDWSKRGFGPDDVTWCEVKADVVALVAPYAERIRQLERELAERKTASIGKDVQFVSLLDIWCTEVRIGDRVSQREAWAKFIAYIDGRTAGVAIPEHRNIFEHKRVGDFTVQLSFKSARAAGAFVEAIAAPSPQQGKEGA
jgi:hypothetical protein